LNQSRKADKENFEEDAEPEMSKANNTFERESNLSQKMKMNYSTTTVKMTNNSMYHRSINDFLDSNLRTIAELIELKNTIDTDIKGLKKANEQVNEEVVKQTEKTFNVEKDISKAMEEHNCLVSQNTELEKALMAVRQTT